MTIACLVGAASLTVLSGGVDAATPPDTTTTTTLPADPIIITPPILTTTTTITPPPDTTTSTVAATPVDTTTAEPLPVVVDVVDLAPLDAAALPALLAVAPASSCLRDATTDPDNPVTTCSLFARAGTVNVDATTPLDVWVFDDSGADTDPIELLNPVIEVTEGDTLSIELTNVNVPAAVSLSMPAAPGEPNSTGGAGPYSFDLDALTPGTYVYQAGPTPTGSVQIAMGMAGLVIVRPADYDPLDSTTFTLDGSGLTTFGDEIVAVANEFDPGLNGDPFGFDLAQYTPTIFTLNGQSHEGGELPEMQAGTKLLVRAANLGLMQRRIGFDQVRLTQYSAGSHRLDNPLDQAAVTLPPGDVADALTMLPVDMDISIALLDHGQSSFIGRSSDLAGQVQIWHLPGVGAEAGPKISNFVAAPEFTDGSVPLALTADITGNIPDQAPTVRYFLDHLNPGDTGTLIPDIAGGGTGWSVSGDVIEGDLASLANGQHVVWLQAGQNIGTADPELWGPVVGFVFVIDREGPVVHSMDLDPALSNGATTSMTIHGTADTTLTGPGSDVQEVKYTIDGIAPTTDAMPGVGLSLAFDGDNPQRAAFAGTIAITGMSDGLHTIYVYALDSFPLGAHWSQNATPITFVIDQGLPVVDSVTISPTPNNGAIAYQGSQIFLDAVRLEAVITDPPITGMATGSSIVEAEFSIGVTALAAGSGDPMGSATARWSDIPQQVYADIPLADIRSLPEGEILFWVRGRDAAGNWSGAVSVTFVLDRTAPTIAFDAPPGSGQVSFTVDDPLPGSGVALVEWFYTAAGEATAAAVAGPNPYQLNGLTPGAAVTTRATDGVGNVRTSPTTAGP